MADKYTFDGTDPLRFFNRTEPNNVGYTEDELMNFYFKHFPEVKNASFEDAKIWLESMNLKLIEQ